ncbi:MAG: hypothetical protein ACJZ59_07255 [Candidatus Thalassarchaeaceae archaeon]
MPRLGRELAGAAKLAGVAGIFHSDELPAYGIEQEHVNRVRENLSLSDALMHSSCASLLNGKSHLALESVVERARVAHLRIPAGGSQRSCQARCT